MLGVSDERWEALERENERLERENARLTRRVDELRPLAARGVRNADLEQQLAPLCPCNSNPSTSDGPQRECPIHGDGTTFVDHVQRLENLAMAARDLRAQNVYALNPERPVWRRFADAVVSLDGAG